MSLLLLNRTTAGAEAAAPVGSIPVRLPTFHARYIVIKAVGNWNLTWFWISSICFHKKTQLTWITVTKCVVDVGWFQSYFLFIDNYVSCFWFQRTRDVAFCGFIWCMCPSLPSFVGQRLYRRSSSLFGKWMCTLEKCIWVSSIPSSLFSSFS